MKMMSKFALALALFFTAATVAAAAPHINTLEKKGWGYKHNGVAIRGFDTVAYFTEGKAIKGSKSITTSWDGAEWRFSKKEHLDMFVAAPEKFAPQYGGYCAYGVAVDNLVKIEGDLWDIVNGKLYLNYNKKFQKKWRANPQKYIQEADQKFDGLLRTQS